jgi:hypothetical protein
MRQHSETASHVSDCGTHIDSLTWSLRMCTSFACWMSNVATAVTNIASLFFNTSQLPELQRSSHSDSGMVAGTAEAPHCQQPRQ